MLIKKPHAISYLMAIDLIYLSPFARYAEWKCAWPWHWPLEWVKIKRKYANRNCLFVGNNNAFPSVMVCEIFTYELGVLYSNLWPWQWGRGRWRFGWKLAYKTYFVVMPMFRIHISTSWSLRLLSTPYYYYFRILGEMQRIAFRLML